MKKMIIFDFDDTIMEYANQSIPNFINAADKIGLQLEINDLKNMWSLPWDQTLKNLLPKDKITEFNSYYKIETKKSKRKLIKGALNTVLKLKKQGYLLGILTSRSQESLDEQFLIADLDKQLFNIILSKDNNKFTKPDPRTFNPIFKYLKKEKIDRDIIYVGDSLSDFVAAKDSNIKFIGVLSGLCSVKDFNAIGCENLIETIDSLPEFLEKNIFRKDKIIRSPKTRITTEYGVFDSYVYKDENDLEHFVLINKEEKLSNSHFVRIHSECLTGDVFGSLMCDCGNQLNKSLQMIKENGEGVLIYLRQEGRNIGLLNKLRAYNLQQIGYDTVQANFKLGFDADQRDYKIASLILKDLKINNISLITNNPDKINNLKKNDVCVKQIIPLITKTNNHNSKYISTKIKKMRHLI